MNAMTHTAFSQQSLSGSHTAHTSVGLLSPQPETSNHARHGSGQQQLDYQVQDLIARVFVKVKKPLLIVNDGFDECVNKPDNIAPHLLKLLCATAHDHPCIRVFITTRPETHVMDVLESPESSNLITFRNLSQAEKDTDGDIALYIESTFRESGKGGLPLLLEREEGVIENLTRLSVELFVYANTVLRSLANAGVSRFIAASDLTL